MGWTGRQSIGYECAKRPLAQCSLWKRGAANPQATATGPTWRLPDRYSTLGPAFVVWPSVGVGFPSRWVVERSARFQALFDVCPSLAAYKKKFGSQGYCRGR